MGREGGGEPFLELADAGHAFLGVLDHLAEEERPGAERDFSAAGLGEGTVVDERGALRVGGEGGEGGSGRGDGEG